MLLNQNGLIEMRYNASSDILTVKWPDIRGFALSEVVYSFELMRNAISHYDIKKLLIDSSKNAVEVSPESYLAIMKDLVYELSGTRLQKIARLGALNQAKETKLGFFSSLLSKEKLKDIRYSNFYEAAEALTWLEQG